VDEAERLLALEALGDQLAVARLEDVERHLLRPQQDDPQRGQTELPRPSLRPCATRGSSVLLNDEDRDGREQSENGDEPHVPTLWRRDEGSLSGSSGMCRGAATTCGASP